MSLIQYKELTSGLFIDPSVIDPTVTTSAGDTVLLIRGKKTYRILPPALLASDPGSYGEIYVADGVTAQAIPNGAAYTQLTAFNTAQGANGVSNILVADKTTSKISVPGFALGRYLCTFTLSGQSDTDCNLLTAVFLNGVEQNQIHSEGFITSGITLGLAGSGFLDVMGAWDVTLNASHDQSAPINLTPYFINFSMHRIGALP